MADTDLMPVPTDVEAYLRANPGATAEVYAEIVADLSAADPGFDPVTLGDMNPPDLWRLHYEPRLRARMRRRALN